MKIVETYSHQNGLKYLIVHQPDLWNEVQQVIRQVDANACLTKVSKELRMMGQLKYSPKDMNKQFMNLLDKKGWHENRVSYWVTGNVKLIRRTLSKTPDEQKQEIEGAGETPIYSYNQTDFVKNRVALEVQFGKYAFVAYDLFVKHLAFYVQDEIDVGIEILAISRCKARCLLDPAITKASYTT